MYEFEPRVYLRLHVVCIVRRIISHVIASYGTRRTLYEYSIAMTGVCGIRVVAQNIKNTSSETFKSISSYIYIYICLAAMAWMDYTRM